MNKIRRFLSKGLFWLAFKISPKDRPRLEHQANLRKQRQNRMSGN